MDNLPAGLCFFSPSGLVVLCNRQMQRLVFALTGRDLQTLADLTPALEAEGGVIRLADGRVWRFRSSTVTDEEGNDYIQVATDDLSDLYRVRGELEAQNSQLQQLNARLKRLSLRSAETVREQEILSAKMRVHNKMGSCVLDLRKFAAQGCPGSEKAQLLANCRQTLAALQSEIGQEDDVDPCAEVVRVAGNLGLAVVIEGEMPENQDTAYLLVIALRECITNTIRHGGGTRLKLALSYQGGKISAVFTDNGTPPSGAFAEGGGLKSLREQMERAGGSLTVAAQPLFSVTVTLPELVNEESEDVSL